MKTITDADFEKYLHKIAASKGTDWMLSLGDVYSTVSETLNNEVLEAWRNDNPIPEIGAQLDTLVPEWTKLIASLIPDIDDDYRASDDPEDDTPGMSVTVGFTPESEDKDASWSYQTGDNSFTGGAYGHRNWGVVSIYRDSKPSEVAEDIASQIGESLAY